MKADKKPIENPFIILWTKWLRKLEKCFWKDYVDEPLIQTTLPRLTSVGERWSHGIKAHQMLNSSISTSLTNLVIQEVIIIDFLFFYIWHFVVVTKPLEV